MYRPVTSNIVIKSELADMLRSAIRNHHALAQHIPGPMREIFSAGFYAGIAAVSDAYGLDVRPPSPPPGAGGEIVGG